MGGAIFFSGTETKEMICLSIFVLLADLAGVAASLNDVSSWFFSFGKSSGLFSISLIGLRYWIIWVNVLKNPVTSGSTAGSPGKLFFHGGKNLYPFDGINT